jgi:hypothetical protein
MPATEPPGSWLAAQRWRLRVLRRDGVRLAVALARTLRTALTPPAPHPSLALLEGPPAATRGAPNVHRVRVHNPTDAPCTVRVLLRGTPTGGAGFTVETTLSLAPGATTERWLVSRWQGDAALTDVAPPENADWATDVDAAGTREGWELEARLDVAGAAVEQLRIGGALR